MLNFCATLKKYIFYIFRKQKIHKFYFLSYLPSKNTQSVSVKKPNKNILTTPMDSTRCHEKSFLEVIMRYIFLLLYSYKKKSMGIKSGLRGGQFWSPRGKPIKSKISFWDTRYSENKRKWRFGKVTGRCASVSCISNIF